MIKLTFNGDYVLITYSRFESNNQKIVGSLTFMPVIKHQEAECVDVIINYRYRSYRPFTYSVINNKTTFSSAYLHIKREYSNEKHGFNTALTVPFGAYAAEN